MSAALQTILVIMIIGSSGLFLGHIRVAGVKIGIAGVLFAGVLAGHFGAEVPEVLVEFLRDFGLILFVYLVGLQVGPGFISTLKHEGKVLVPFTLGIVLLGTLLASLLPALLGIPIPAALGILAGATTNTPSLAAAQEALGEGASELLGVGYAISYPGAVVGLILTMTLLRVIFRIDMQQEQESLKQTITTEKVSTRSIKVENVNLHELPLSKLPALKDLGVVISRMETRDGMILATPESIIHLGDTLLAVGEPEALDQLTLIVGRPSPEDLSVKPSPLIVKNLFVTDPQVSGKTTEELQRSNSGNFRITRIRRGDVEFTATDEVRLQRGDQVRVVGAERVILELEKLLGNSPRVLETFNFLPLFVGIALGVAIGLYEFQVPALPSAIKLGLAGGPLLVALILSRFAHSATFPTYVPYGANIALRELGMMLFLAAVGLKAGPKFFSALLSPQGALWVVCGAVVTVVPLLVCLIAARRRKNLNFLLLCGLAAGSLTDPPALAFANSLAPQSNAPAVAYATAYPFAMVLRIICIQILAIVLMS